MIRTRFKALNLDRIKEINLITCYIAMVLNGFYNGIFVILLQPLILRFTGSLFHVGIIITIATFVQVASMPFIGKLSDRYGRKLIWLIAFIRKFWMLR